MNLGCRHPHQNCLVHSCCRRHHYGGAVDNLSGCKKPLFPSDRPRRCSMVSIQKLACFPSVADYPPYLAL